MYKFSYDEILVDDSSRQKQSERDAIEHSINLLRKAQTSGSDSKEAVEALAFVNRLWSFFIEDLCKPENALPADLKAKLISVGLWLMREGEKISDSKSDNFDGLIDVSQTLAEGLK